MLSSEEKERLLVVPDDDVLLTRMCFLSEHDLALINKHRRPANRLGFAVLLCYLRGPGFPPDKNISPHDGVVSRLAAHLKLQPDLWAEYASREVTRWEHLAELYRYLELSPFNRALQKACIRHLYPKQNGLAKALREIGRIERSLFMLGWFRDPSLRRRVQAGLNKGEARNALARAVFMHRLGEIRDRGLENQSYRASGLTLLTAAISLWNTVYIERAIDSLKRKGIPFNDQLISHLSPLGWEHINLSGDYVWRTNLKLGQGKYRSLRSVDSSLYKKQA
ncbi:DUF4158 domain-containing protein [Yersinia enterocolitica]|nr:DUF4158 domain-containing protein [Yersinia enterocolitica]EKN6293025.1 DUF4158 domain-containing protein [Yersinia enterocolitica]EKN6302203.1 DUF4158 domain-containing protein [Yersinia enterocolitica]EKN6314336.1 DUF4158 domain-containing protein [Yersinia enterocolitica]